MTEPRRSTLHFHHPNRLARLHHHIQIRHNRASIQRSEMRLHTAEPSLILGELLFELGSPEPQHAAQLIDGRVLGKHLADLLQAQTEIPQRDQPVQARKLPRTRTPGNPCWDRPVPA